MAQDPTRDDDQEACDQLAKAGDEAISTELEDLELVDSDQTERVARLMAAKGPPAPDPAAITARLAEADLEAMLGDVDAPTPAASGPARSLADRMSFDDMPKAAPQRRPSRPRPEPRRSGLARLLGWLFGRRG
jgi:hypothetical protein